MFLRTLYVRHLDDSAYGATNSRSLIFTNVQLFIDVVNRHM